MRRTEIPLLAAASVFLWFGAAEAHLVTTGLGPVYDGIGHVLLSFEDLLPVVAVALLAGLNGKVAGRCMLFTLPLAWLVGGAAGYASAAPLLPAGFASLSLLLLGALTAADRRLRPSVMTTLAAILGIVHGWSNGAGIAAAGRQGSGLIGIALAIFVLAALVSAWVLSLRKPWTRIVVRVAGSWIAAVGLLLLGWTLRGSN